MPEPASPASGFATEFLARLRDLGVRHVVVCPGSRSQALALAAADAGREGGLRVHVRIDERSAAFLAQGLARATGMPVPVITTSGTAVANLHPAMLEAWHSGDGLVAVTADRPAELRGRGVNQTTTQPGVFGPAATWEIDVPAPNGRGEDETVARDIAERAFVAAHPSPDRAAPVHVNLQFREPLSGPSGPPSAAQHDVPADVSRPEPYTLSHGPRTVVLAGTGAGPAAEALARSAGWPLLAEVTSGARFGPNLVRAYRAVLDAMGERVERAVVFGRPNLSRQVPALLLTPGLEVVLVAQRGAEAYDPSGTGVRVEDVRATGEDPDSGWLREWIAAGRALEAPPEDAAYQGGGGQAVTPAQRSALMRAELAAVRAPVSRRALVEAVWRASWPHDRLWFAASRLVREADTHVPGKKIPVYANRGLAGIDGTISAAMGAALAAADEPRGAAGTTRVLIGDLAFLHDVGGLLIPPGEPRPRIQLVVGNDGGGSIFDGLEVRGTAESTLFDRVMYTPHDVRLEALAEAYGWAYTKAASRGDLDRALTSPAAGPSIVEVPLAR